MLRSVTAISRRTRPNLHFPLRFRVQRDFSAKMPSKTQDKYTDPELRQEVKEEIQAGDKGGAPGQWSARKVYHHIQLL
jgi:hypothetical protein